MNEQEARLRLMEYLYDEMNSFEKQEFERVLKENPDLQAELDDFGGTRKLLESVPLETPAHKLVVVNDTHSSKRWFQSNAMRTSMAIAAAMLVMVIAFSFVKLRFEISESGFAVSFGEAVAVTEEVFTEDEVIDLVQQIREENAVMLTSVIEESREQQRRQLEETVATLTSYYDRRRQQDLILISEGLAQLEEETYYRFLQTDEALDDLIYAMSYQQSQSLE